MDKKPEITESTATEFVLVRDKAGNEFVCKLSDLKESSSVSEEEKDQCIENVREYWDSVA